MNVVQKIATLSILTALVACAPDSALDDLETADETGHSISNADETTAAPQFVMVRRDSSSNCSATMLTRHWLLTAAHCAGEASLAEVEVRWVNQDTDAVETIFDGVGVYYVHAQYEPGKAENDVALIYLGGGADEEWRGRLYADEREPWRQSYSGSREFSVIGWGRGSDTGSASECPAGGAGVKRRSDGWQLSPTSAAKPKQAAATHPTQALCKGDSGTSWSLRRDKKYLTFAVHSGGTGTEKASLVAPKLSWIEATLAGSAACKRLETGDGFAYVRCKDDDS